MKKRNIIFGTDGWRGLLDEELNKANIRRVAQAFAGYLQMKRKGNRVAIGYDGRENSNVFAGIFAQVLKGNGIEVLLTDRIVPTPVVSYTCVHSKCDAGVMITASHNPPQYNGIKFKAAHGSPFATEETALVEALIDKSGMKYAEDRIEATNLTKNYLAHLEKLIDFDSIQSSGLKIAVDSMAGAGGTMLQDLLGKYGLACKTIFGTPETDFAGRLAEPVERNLQPLSEMLKNGNFSLGLATDGDADRLGVMTNTGQWMNAQEAILALGSYYRLHRGVPGPMVKTASVTDQVRKVFPPEEVFDVQVGFKYVAEAMIEKQAAFGAEESGGFGFKEHLPERDGIFSGLLFLEMLARSGYKKLDDFIENQRNRLGVIHYDRIDIKSNSHRRHEVLPRLAVNPPERIGNHKIDNLQTYQSSRGIINGLKLSLEGNPRWLLLRVSETEPMVRVYAEAECNGEVAALLHHGMMLLDEYMSG